MLFSHLQKMQLQNVRFNKSNRQSKTTLKNLNFRPGDKRNPPICTSATILAHEMITVHNNNCMYSERPQFCGFKEPSANTMYDMRPMLLIPTSWHVKFAKLRP